MKKQHLLKLAIFSLSMILLLSCASTTQLVQIPDQTKPVENPQNCRIYVMRPTSFGCAIPIKVTDNNETIGNTGPKGYLCWETAAGNNTLQGFSENISNLTLTTEAGKTYYVHQKIRLGLIYARNKLKTVDETTGKKILSKCNPPKKK